MKTTIRQWIEEKVLPIILIGILVGIVYFVAGFLIEDQSKRASLSAISVASYLIYCKHNTGKIDTEDTPFVSKGEFYVLGILFGLGVIFCVIISILILLQ